MALNAIQFLVWLKIFGPVQNILGPVKGQGINRQEDNLKVWLLIKSVFYIVPKSSITLLSWLAVKPTAQFDKIKVY